MANAIKVLIYFKFKFKAKSRKFHGCTPLACCMVIHHTHAQSVYLSHAHCVNFVLMPFLHVLTYFQAYCIVAKMASQGEAESQVPSKNHVLKIPEREALTVHQSSERLEFYGRQLHVVSIQVYDHETSFHISILSLFKFFFQFLLYDCTTK